MERAIFYMAVAAAIIVALGAAFTGPAFHFVDAEGFGPEPVIEATAGEVGPQAYQANEIDIRNAAARIVVTPEDRQDILLQISNSGRVPTPTITLRAGHLIVDGRLRGRVGSCREGEVSVGGYGEIATAELPQIQVRVPMHAIVSVGGANITEIGPSQSLNGDFAGCGQVTIADVSETLTLDVAGGPSVRAGAAADLDLDLAGGGDVTVGAISQHAAVSIGGGGDIVLASLNGGFSSEIAGAGSVRVESGAVTNGAIEIAGAGHVHVAAPMQQLSVEIAGAGDVDVPAVVGELDVEIAGSGNVRVQSVTGSVRREIMGAGNIEIGEGGDR